MKAGGFPHQIGEEPVDRFDDAAVGSETCLQIALLAPLRKDQQHKSFVSANVRPAKPIDGLFRISNDKKFSRRQKNVPPGSRLGLQTFGQKEQHFPLEGVGVLKLVDQDRAVSRFQFTTHVRVIGQIPICWDPDEDTAVKRAHEQFRWFGGGWQVNADLPTPAGFSGATQFVRPEDVAGSIPCGPDLDMIVESVSAYWKAGFTDVAIVQVGDDGQDRFLDEAARPLLEKLRAASS